MALVRASPAVLMTKSSRLNSMDRFSSCLEVRVMMFSLWSNEKKVMTYARTSIHIPSALSCG